MTDSKPGLLRTGLGIGLLVLALGLVGFGVYSVTVGEDKRLEEPNHSLNAKISEAVKLGQSGEYERAVVMLREIVQEYPKNTAALYNYGIALKATKDLTGADEIFKKINTLWPDDFEAVVERASIAILEDDLDRAFDYLEEVPRGKGKLILRLRSDPQWQSLSKHSRMKKIRAQQGLDKLNY